MWILPPHSVSHRTSLLEQVVESLCVAVNGIWDPVCSMSGSLSRTALICSWDNPWLHGYYSKLAISECSLEIIWRDFVLLAEDSLFLFLSLALRCVSDLQKVWEYVGSSSIIICSLLTGICSWVCFVQPFTSDWTITSFVSFGWKGCQSSQENKQAADTWLLFGLFFFKLSAFVLYTKQHNFGELDISVSCHSVSVSVTLRLALPSMF